jgi:hypothetical protein
MIENHEGAYFRTSTRAASRAVSAVKNNTNSTTGKVAPSATIGAKGALATRIVSHLRRMRPAPVSTATASGTAVISQAPTVVPPPNAVDAVTQQLDTSTQLAENTATGTGTGAGTSSAPVTKRVLNTTAYAILAALGMALLVAFLFDRGKL